MSNRLAERPLPAGWKARSLKDVVSRVTRRNDVKNGNVLTISAREGLVNQEEFFSRRVASMDLSPYFLLERGDFAYNKSYSAGFPVGVIRRLDRYPQGVVSPLYICFRPSSPYVSSDYLTHYFQSGLLDDDIAWIAKEGARNHGLLNVGVDDLFSVPIHVPPFAEQVRIAEILDTADEAIRSSERLVAKLEQARQGLLHDLFTRGIDENGALRRIDQVHRVNGRNLPAGWRLCPLSEITEVSRGQFTHRPRNDPAYYGGEYPFIQTGDVTRASGGYISDAVQTLSKLGASVSLKFPAGTIAVTIAANIADTGILSVPMYFPDSVVGVKVHAPHNIRFVELCIRSAKPGLEARAPQSAQKNINLKDLRPLIIPLPDHLEQARIASVYEGRDRLAAIARHELAKLKSLKQGLMEDLLTGRVRVGASG